MLAVNAYSQEYINDCRAKVNLQLATYRALRAAAQANATDEAALNNTIGAFEAQFFNNLLHFLDNLFMHRTRALELKDGNPLNEFRIVCNSLLTNEGKMKAEKSIKLDTKTSILKYQVGDEIRLNEADFVRMAEAFFSEIESKFLETTPEMG